MTSEKIKKQLDKIQKSSNLEGHLTIMQWKKLALDLAILISKILNDMENK